MLFDDGGFAREQVCTTKTLDASSSGSEDRYAEVDSHVTSLHIRDIYHECVVDYVRSILCDE